MGSASRELPMEGGRSEAPVKPVRSSHERVDRIGALSPSPCPRFDVRVCRARADTRATEDPQRA